MKGNLFLLFGSAALVLALVGEIPANAYTLDCGASCPTQTWTTSTNSNLNASDIQTITGFNLTLLYKAEVGGGESGLTSSYETTFSNTTTDPANFLIDYISGTSISCPTCILVVKDGRNDPSQYLFNLGSWNGTTDIVGTGFWPNQGGISNVAIWGTSTSVPEPTTLLLLGVGLAGIGIYRRKFEMI
jgi:hypothetical protein